MILNAVYVDLYWQLKSDGLLPNSLVKVQLGLFGQRLEYLFDTLSCDEGSLVKGALKKLQLVTTDLQNKSTELAKQGVELKECKENLGNSFVVGLELAVANSSNVDLQTQAGTYPFVC